MAAPPPFLPPPARFTLNPRPLLSPPSSSPETLFTSSKMKAMRNIDTYNWEKIPTDLRMPLFKALKAKKRLKDRHFLLLEGRSPSPLSSLHSHSSVSLTWFRE